VVGSALSEYEGSQAEMPQALGSQNLRLHIISQKHLHQPRYRLRPSVQPTSKPLPTKIERDLLPCYSFLACPVWLAIELCESSLNSSGKTIRPPSRSLDFHRNNTPDIRRWDVTLV